MTLIQFEKYEPNDLDNMLRICAEMRDVLEEFNKQYDKLSYEIKRELKVRKWESYQDKKSKVSVSIVKKIKERINRQALNILLNEEQYNQILIQESENTIQIVTDKDRKRLKKYAKKNN
jgi:hypothetical protein